MRRRLTGLIAAAALLAPSAARPQADVPPQVFPDLPQFYVDALAFAGDEGKARLDLYVEVPYEALRFTKEDDVFRASYEVTVDIYDSSSQLLDDHWWTEKIETATYDESVAPTIGNLSERTFHLAPGAYEVGVQIKDHETGKMSHVRRKLRVRDYARGDFLISDIMLVNRVDTAGGRRTVYPNISGNVGELKDGFTYFFEMYNRVKADSMRVTSVVRNVRGDVVGGDTVALPAGGERSSCFLHERTTKLIAGDYILEVTAAPLHPAARPGDPPPAPASSSRFFVIRWRGLPLSITDLDLAIDQLQYVADKDTIDGMKNAPAEKKRELFADFWKKRDPTPSSERNELMEEYYSRVAYSNKHFSHYIDGWKTDMGMVYIIFGAPNNIERHPFDIDAKPYEVWTYYELNRQFVFVDATGFGDFRLQNPIWDVSRTRPR